MSIHVVYMLYVHGEQRAKENLHGNRTFSETKGIPMVCLGFFFFLTHYHLLFNLCDFLSFSQIQLWLCLMKFFGFVGLSIKFFSFWAWAIFNFCSNEFV